MIISKIIEKPEGAEWQLKLRVHSCLNTTEPDPRDDTDTAITLDDAHRYGIQWKDIDGVSGWDREYVGDNQVHLKYHVANTAVAQRVMAINRLHLMHRKANEPELENHWKNKNYVITWKLYDDNGSEIPLPESL